MDSCLSGVGEGGCMAGNDCSKGDSLYMICISYFTGNGR